MNNLDDVTLVGVEVTVTGNLPVGLRAGVEWRFQIVSLVR